jgi:hypothetical protein
MKIFKELKKLGYIHYSATTIEELDDLPLNSAERVSEQALVLRWFREKYNLFGKIQPYDDVNTLKMAWEYVILDINWGPDYEVYFNCRLDLFKTPEEAEVECLKKLIEICKKN